MNTDSGGWTEIAEINLGDNTWSLYDTDMNINSSINSKRGFALNRFSNSSFNSDLEFLISVDNNPKIIYSNLNLDNVFNNSIASSTLQTDPFL